MTTYLQGSTATLVVQWREYAPNGPLVDVNTLTVTITALSGGAPTVGPTAVGIAHPATGVYVYNWAIPDGQTAGDYLVEWDATDVGTGDPVSASEIVTVATVVSGSLPAGLCEAWDPIWCCVLTDAQVAITGTAVAAATEVLWQAAMQRFGLCQVTLRPCRRECPPPVGGWWQWPGAGSWPTPTLRDGVWTNVTCGACGSTCACTDVSEVVLPGPVYDIVEVKIDGVPLVDGVDYRLDDDRILVRLGGQDWPYCQEFNAADTEPDTWSVTARFGETPTILARQAVGELACEMVRACTGEDCRLPRNVQQLVRQGVTISFPENEDIVRRGYFGKLFLDTYNPHRLPGRPVVYDVDGPSFRRTGT